MTPSTSDPAAHADIKRCLTAAQSGMGLHYTLVWSQTCPIANLPAANKARELSACNTCGSSAAAFVVPSQGGRSDGGECVQCGKGSCEIVVHLHHLVCGILLVPLGWPMSSSPVLKQEQPHAAEHSNNHLRSMKPQQCPQGAGVYFSSKRC